MNKIENKKEKKKGISANTAGKRIDTLKDQLCMIKQLFFLLENVLNKKGLQLFIIDARKNEITKLST